MLNYNSSFYKRILNEPVYCFLIHTDWASESMLEFTINYFESRNIKLTPYITNPSEIIKTHYSGKKSKYVGLHPNFLPNSSHGSNYFEITEYITKLWPDARSYACHCFYDNIRTTDLLFEKGLKYDSNLCLHLQPNIVPLNHCSGSIRFPVFFEDDIYARYKGNWSFSGIQTHFETPGLKLINFHPIHICLNTPDFEFYNSTKQKDLSNWNSYVFAGNGTYTFLEDLSNYINNQNIQTYYLDELFDLCQKE